MDNSGNNTEEPNVIAQLVDMITHLTHQERLILLKNLKGKHFKEKRIKPRKANPALLDYAVKGRVYHGFIHDISVGGVFIETAESIAVGQDILTMIPVPNSPRSIKVMGNVVRKTPHGIGVKFRRRSGNS
ncbi:MAG: PilZ domain-containing protein [Desulfatiglandaceae bacterium]